MFHSLCLSFLQFHSLYLLFILPFFLSPSLSLLLCFISVCISIIFYFISLFFLLSIPVMSYVCLFFSVFLFSDFLCHFRLYYLSFLCLSFSFSFPCVSNHLSLVLSLFSFSFHLSLFSFLSHFSTHFLTLFFVYSFTPTSLLSHIYASYLFQHLSISFKSINTFFTLSPFFLNFLYPFTQDHFLSSPHLIQSITSTTMSPPHQIKYVVCVLVTFPKFF
jgi:hypothetical protein